MVAKKLSATALSQHSPANPTDNSTPLARASSAKSRLVYWQPRSEWKITPAGGRRCTKAISSASVTSSVRMWSASAQPTTLRLARSMTVAR